MSHGALGIGHGRCAVRSTIERSKPSLMIASATDHTRTLPHPERWFVPAF
jgi:hypothetical protein